MTRRSIDLLTSAKRLLLKTSTWWYFQLKDTCFLGA